MASSTNWQWTSWTVRMGARTGQGHLGPPRATSLAICTCPRPPQRPPWPTLLLLLDCNSVSWVAPVASRMCTAKPLSFSSRVHTIPYHTSHDHTIPHTPDHIRPTKLYAFALHIISAYFWVSAVTMHCTVGFDTVLRCNHSVYSGAIPFTVKWIPAP